MALSVSTGDICVKELLHALVDCGVDADAKHTKEVCAKYDLDGNGKLCIKEFAVLVQDAMHGSVAGDAPNVDPVVLSVFRKHDKDGSGMPVGNVGPGESKGKGQDHDRTLVFG